MSQSQLLNECAFPRCTAGNGQPELVEDGVFCQPCKRRYRKMLDWLAMDYVALRELPPLARPNDERLGKTAKAKSFGHPAEWASDMAAYLASYLNEVEDDLREQLGHTPAIHPHAGESVRVRRAHRYLWSHFEQLCRCESAADTAIGLDDLHHKIRVGLGQTKQSKWLEGFACPACGKQTLYLSVGEVSCRSCGESTPEAGLGLLERMAKDDMMVQLRAWKERRGRPRHADETAVT